MTIGIVGLGLIGGSLARAVKKYTDFQVLATDRDPETLAAARQAGAVDAPLPAAGPLGCDLLLVALYPQDTVAYVRDNAPRLKGAVVVDCCGVKQAVCDPCFALASEHGFTFVGGHPMAGTERSGFLASRADLFAGASMLLVPEEEHQRLPRLEALFSRLGFGRVVYTTAQEHDDTIAYTSQLAHVVSSAYIKSPTAQRFAGFSAGSFRDMTRVAYLNEDMWAELFLDNRQALLREIEEVVGHLEEYASVLREQDKQGLRTLLLEGKRAKMQTERGEEEG